MTHAILHAAATRFAQARPEIRPGYTVRVHERIKEGEKERIQMFEGLVISVHNGHTSADASFTVRRIASGVGVEKVFPLHSPRVEKVEVKKVAKVRRAKLFFLRGRQGKAARLTARFTTAGEFEVPDTDSAPEASDADVAESTDVETSAADTTNAAEESTPSAEAPEEAKAEEEEKTQA